MIDQITVFLENEKGRLASLCRTIGDGGINMHALMVADTTDFGVVRIICDAPSLAKRTLEDGGYRANITKVAAIKIPDEPAALACLLECLEKMDVNVEYLYCFAHPSDDKSVAVLKIAGQPCEIEALNKAGFTALQPQDLYTSREL